jgi:asparagine synthase (glutamine-hydrolysing)
MCGIFFKYSKKTIKQSEIKNLKKKILKYLVKRGPDRVKEIHENNWYGLHSLLSITNNKQVQPILINNRFVAIYNGEIYNDWRKYSSSYGDTDFLVNHIKKYGIDNLKKLDGEYAVIVYDLKKNILYLAKDPFGTKPLHYAINKNKEIIVTSYGKTIEDLGIKKKDIISAPPNSLLKIDLNKNFEVKTNNNLKNFIFNNKKKTTYNDFSLAFTNAIKKRVRSSDKKIFIGLSSGHDSGLIAAELNKLKTSFSSYSVFYGEVKNILKKRIKILSKNKKIYLKNLSINSKNRDSIKKYLKKYAPYVNVNLDNEKIVGMGNKGDFRDLSGFIATAYIAKTAKENGEKIFLSGQGADEIISDYFNIHTNSRKSCMKGDWSKATKPWRNFYGGWNAAFIAAQESIAGAYGLETRYPFLDYKLVQTFLSLPNDLKSKVYKAPITHILKKYSFPYHDFKIGFYGYKRR